MKRAKKVIPALITFVIGALVGCTLLYYFLPRPDDTAYHQQVIEYYQMAQDARADNWTLTQQIWDLQAQVEDATQELDTTVWFYKRDIEKLSNYYEELYQRAIDEIDNYQQQVETLQKELAKKVYGGWQGLENFDDMAEVHRFLSEESLWRIDYEPVDFDCDDFMFTMMQHGAAKGKAVYPVIVFSLSGNQIVSSHTMNFVIVSRYVPEYGDKAVIVLIEPQTLETFIVGVVDDKATWNTQLMPFLP
jgi:hypothetical protein